MTLMPDIKSLRWQRDIVQKYAGEATRRDQLALLFTIRQSAKAGATKDQIISLLETWRDANDNAVRREGQEAKEA